MATTIQQIELPKKARAVDTSGNNNHGQIYSGRGLEFDGVGDYLSIADDASIRPTDNITVACWVYLNSSTGWQTIWGKKDNIANGIWIAIESDGQVNVELDGVVSYTSFNSGNNKLADGVWYRLVMTYDYLSGGVIYINGQSAGSVSDTGAITQPSSTAYQIGNMDSGYVLDGNMSDFQLWDSTWTAADVTYDYLNPESLALNNSGTALTESNLKLWYPMQDGHRGQQSYILDGANTGLGDDLVTNGTFDSDLSGWTGQAGRGSYAWDSSIAKITNDDTSNYPNLTQSVTTVAGQVYKVNATVEIGTASTIEVRVYDGANLGSQQLTTDGEVEFYFTAVGTSTSLILYLWETGSTGHYCFFDNVSVKAINDKHHATTVFYGDEMHTQGNAASTTNETDATTGWTNSNFNTFESSNATSNNGTYSIKFIGDSTSDYAHINFTTVVGRTYKITWNRAVTVHTSTKLFLFKAGTSANNNTYGEVNSWESNATTSWTSSDNAIEFVATTTTTYFTVTAHGDDASGTLYFDALSVKEVGVASGWTDADQQLHIPQTALQSYNELAWSDGGSSSAYVASLGASLGTNDFALSYVINCDTDDIKFLTLNKAASEGRIIHRLTSGRLRIYAEDSNGTFVNYLDATADSSLVSGQTYHVVEVYDRAADLITTYVNGVASGVTIDISSLSGSIGCDGSFVFNLFSGTSLAGIITEVALWKNTKLDATEVLELYNDGKPLDALLHTKASTLYGYWRNNGLSTWVNLANPGTKDTSSNTLTETILIPQGVDSTRDAQGFIMNKQKDTSCLNLTEGSDEAYVVVKNNPTIQFGSGGSVGFWMKPKGTPPTAGYCILNNGAGGSRNPRITLQSNLKINFFWEIADGTNKDTNATNAVTEGEWTYVVCTWDGTTNKIYLNNALDKSEAESGTPDTDTADLYIGKDQTGSDGNFKGYLDGITFYSDVLSLEEVKRNYNATKGSHRN